MRRWMKAGLLGAFALGSRGTASQAADTEGRFYCALNALSPSERLQHLALGTTLRAAVTARHALENGYAFEIKESVMGWEGLTRWVGYERRCCPFFHFRVAITPGQPLVLELTGAPGIKRFIETEMGSGPS
jgi:hypothetical protein